MIAKAMSGLQDRVHVLFGQVLPRGQARPEHPEAQTLHCRLLRPAGHDAAVECAQGAVKLARRFEGGGFGRGFQMLKIGITYGLCDNPQHGGMAGDRLCTQQFRAQRLGECRQVGNGDGMNIAWHDLAFVWMPDP